MLVPKKPRLQPRPPGGPPPSHLLRREGEAEAEDGAEDRLVEPVAPKAAPQPMTLQQMVTKHNFVYLQSAAVAAAALHRATEIATGTAPAAPPPPALVQQAILTRTASIVTGSPEAPPTVALVREAILTRSGVKLVRLQVVPIAGQLDAVEFAWLAKGTRRTPITISHRVRFEEVANVVPDSVALLAAPTQSEQPQVEEYIEYFTTRSRAGVARLQKPGLDLYVLPPAAMEVAGLLRGSSPEAAAEAKARVMSVQGLIVVLARPGAAPRPEAPAAPAAPTALAAPAAPTVPRPSAAPRVAEEASPVEAAAEANGTEGGDSRGRERPRAAPSAGAERRSISLQGLCGDWSDSLGHDVAVTPSSGSSHTAEVTLTKPRSSTVRLRIDWDGNARYRCGHYELDVAESTAERVVWRDVRRAYNTSIWKRAASRAPASPSVASPRAPGPASSRSPEPNAYWVPDGSAWSAPARPQFPPQPPSWVAPHLQPPPGDLFGPYVRPAPAQGPSPETSRSSSSGSRRRRRRRLPAPAGTRPASLQDRLSALLQGIGGPRSRSRGRTASPGRARRSERGRRRSASRSRSPESPGSWGAL